MCGGLRKNDYDLPTVAEQYHAQLYHQQLSLFTLPKDIIRPGKKVAVLAQMRAGQRRVLGPMTWGWPGLKDPDKLMYNARAERLLERPTWRAAMQQGHRCLVVADAFYEWSRPLGQSFAFFLLPLFHSLTHLFLLFLRF